MAYVAVAGTRLHVQRLGGSGPPLLLVHGLVDSLASYYFTLAGPAVELGFDVITYDLRGHGRSERTSTGYTIGDAVSDAVGVLDALGVTEPVHLLGYSFGGTVAFALAELHPERVLDVVVVESEPPTEAWAARTVEGLREVETAIVDEEYLAGETEIVRKMAAATRQFEAHTGATAELVDPRWLVDADRIAAIRPPVLLVVGGASDLSTRLDEFVPLLRDCTVAVIPDQEHMLLTYAPREVAEIALPWLHARAAP
ncbi:alpha/beta hydrolase [Actinokineospora sp. NBRC 105648]|uniref:alpha/beta fold hydrolase n=1 Tax=Actinokineospora sp. NBRC 105648 TaxID=3032206 RepID=UPI0024A56A9E|nr:alpha/beta hydrolase [Actinokineospora sp. NBRC 105648]GLZ40429.1 alpha/beta hydrolase [Actinokineospora sp. NBRC 105648]